MKRYAFIALIIAATGATALASINPAEVVVVPKNTTTIAKNQFWPVLGTIVVEQCAKEDCSDTPST
jgi:hypothetical protein